MVVLDREFLINNYGLDKLNELTNISLEFSGISKIDPNAFKDLKKLEILSLKDNQIEELDVRLFQSLSNLRQLILSNNKLVTIDFETFKNLSKLERLSLRDNQIEELDVRLFEDLSNLNTLFLYNNKLKTINWETFKNVNKLFSLYLNNNEIEEIDVRLLENLTNLKNLYLEYNKLKKIDSNIFKNLTKLEVIQFENNEIEEIDLKLFEGLSELYWLSLDYNKLKRIDYGTFENLSRLSTLRLSNNEIEEIDARLFENLSNLKELHLDTNKLERIDFETFKNLTKLETLLLGENAIEELDVRLFESLSNLKVLQLNDNKLKEIDPKLFTPLKAIEVIELYANDNLKALSFLKPSTNRNYDKKSMKKYGFLSDWNGFLQQFADLVKQEKQESKEKKQNRIENDDKITKSSLNQSTNEESKIKDPYIGKLINDRFKVVKKLGRGSFGYVYLVDDIKANESKLKALKIMDQLDWVTENELEMIFHINHENIVRYFEHFHLQLGDENKTLLITEYCENGDLRNRIEEIKWQPNTNFSDKQVLKWMIQTTKALKYLHSKQPTPIIHRDIKPANMLLTAKDEIKLTDLGVAKLMESSYASTYAGTPPYMSPEVFKSFVLEINYYPNTDIWSLGCVLYELIFLRFAFPRGQRGDPPIPSNLSSSVLFSSVLSKMLEKDCSKRITSDALLPILENLEN